VVAPDGERRGAQRPFAVSEPFYATPTLAMFRCPAVGTRPQPARDPGSACPPYEAVLDALARDEPLMRAVAIASPTLAQTVDRWRAGDRLTDKQLRRAAVSLATYSKRMRHRATPFGLFAGVAAAGFSDSPSVSLGEKHVVSIRPSGDWMAAVVRRLEKEPGIAKSRLLSTNNTCFFRGNWLINPYHVRDVDQPLRADEVGVRKTALLTGLYEFCFKPRTYDEVVQWLKQAKPGVAEGRLVAYLGDLLDKNFLITDLRPSPSEPDRLRSVVRKLGGHAAGASELLGALGTLQAKIDSIGNSQPSRDTLDDVSRQMLHLASASKSPLQVDLRVDARVEFPRAVATEAAKAASLLAMLTPQASANQTMKDYEDSFREKFGPDAHVRLLQLIDPVRGLGLPAGGLPKKPSNRPAVTDSGSAETKAALLFRALRDQQKQVELTTDDIEAMAVDWVEDDEHRVPSFDLFASVLADSWSRLVQGDFELLLSPHVSHHGGSALGRFEYLDSKFQDLFSQAQPRSESETEVEAHLIFQPLAPLHLNMMSFRPWLENSIPIGLLSDGNDGLIHLQDLLAGVDERGIYLWSTKLGRRVVPVVHHMFNTATGAPRIVHFLRAIGRRRRRIVWGWNWGPVADEMPFLPGVRHGRTVLALPEWRVPKGLVASRRDERQWHALFEAWRIDMEVPRSASLALDDLDLRLDLDDELDLQIFRQNVSPRSRIVETPSLRKLHGALGDRPHEIVVPVQPAKQPQLSPVVRRPVAEAVRFPPGSEWLYAKLEAEAPGHAEILRDQLPGLLAEVQPHIDSWFFVRYLDPMPHLRLRFRGAPVLLSSEVLPRLSAFAEQLYDQCVARDLTLATYEPEVVRYGGAKAMAYAERVFWRDSEFVLRSLGAANDDGPVPRHVQAASHLCAMADAFLGPGWQEQLVNRLPNRPQAAAFQRHRRQLGRMSSAESAAARAGWPELRDVLHAFARALASDGVNDERQSNILLSLWHMHFNRLVGVERAAEELVLDLVRRAALDAIGRRARS